MNKSKILIILLPVIFLLGIYIGFKIDDMRADYSDYSSSEKFNEVLEYTKDYYFEEIDENKLVETAITGMLEELDPHSVYIQEEQQVGISEQFRGTFDGIGIEFQIINDSITVVSPISGGPSETVGILPGDRIIEIDGKNSIGYTNRDVVLNLRGERGSVVNLKISRPLVQELLDFSIIRDIIPLYTVDASLMISNDIAYISLSKFVETSAFEMKEALTQLEKKGMKKLILDLRNNPGGYMDQAFQIADLFIDNDKLIVYSKGRVSDLDSEYKAKKTYPYEKMPLSILVNRGSASASEIVTGAIQDWDRGIIVGETTFGKGLVQRPFLLQDNSAVRITISKYYTPSGREIQRDFENKADYFGVVYADENDESENIKNDISSDSTETVFKTDGGRIIKAHGGITPDFVVKNKELSYYSVLLRSKDLFYKFTRKYLDSNGEFIFSEYKNDLKTFREKFNFSENELNSFIRFASENEVEFVQEEFEQDKEYIKLRLKAHVARNFWKSDGWYSVLLNSDNQFNKAKELLNINYNILQKLN